MDVKYLLICVCLLSGYCYSLVVWADSNIDTEAEIITVKSPQEIQSKQKLRQFIGISAETANAKALSMNLVVIPPGGQARAHYHDGFESAVYVIQGKVETRYGAGLKKSIINEAGDFIFIPPNVPHQPKNLSETEPAMAIVSRNDPNEQESVIPYQITD